MAIATRTRWVTVTMAWILVLFGTLALIPVIQSSTSTQIPHSSPPDYSETLDSLFVRIEPISKNFRQVQALLDRNRALIQQVNENHQSKSADNMVKNVALIQEINQNVSKVVSLYSNLSSNFSSAFHQRETSGADPASNESSPES